MGEGVTSGGLSFPDTGCPVPDVYINNVSDMNNVWDTVSTFIHLYPRALFLNNGLDNIQWTSFISDLYIKLMIISRRVTGFATGSPCGVWGRELTTCLLYDGPLLGLCFQNDIWCVILVYWRGFIFSSIPCLCLPITQVLAVIFFCIYIFLIWNYFFLY